MDYLKQSLVRSVLALLIGIVLLVWPNEAVHYFFLVFGILLLVSGGDSIWRFVSARKSGDILTPLLAMGICEVLIGAVFVVNPEILMNFLILIFGLILLFVGAYEVILLVSYKQRFGWYYLLPLVVLLMGILLLVNPFSATQAILVMLFGISVILYGVSGIIDYYRIRQLIR